MTNALQTPLFSVDVPESGAAKGHVRITSASSATADISLFGFCSSVISSLLYEKMQAGGTNILIDVSESGVRIDILARHENDGLDMQLPLKPGDPAQLDAVQERIRAKTFFIKPDDVAAPAAASVAAPLSAERSVASSAVPRADGASSTPAIASSPADAPPTKAEEEREDYLSKQLHRIP